MEGTPQPSLQEPPYFGSFLARWACALVTSPHDHHSRVRSSTQPLYFILFLLFHPSLGKRTLLGYYPQTLIL